MKKYLYFNYFRSTDSARRAEYLYCVQRNLAHQFIDGFFVFLDNADHASDIPDDPRVSFITLGRRMEFQDMIDHARENLEDGSVVITINLDVYLAHSQAWSQIDQDFFAQGHDRKAMVCTRHNLKSLPNGHKVDMDIEAPYWLLGNYCDAYVLTTPFVPEFAAEDFRFCVGHAPQCDNLMMGLMSRHYHTYSWGARYVIMHYDICRNANFVQKVEQHADTVDTRAQTRRKEHRNIPTQQAWSTLLQTQQAPVVTYSWFDYSRTTDDWTSTKILMERYI